MARNCILRKVSQQNGFVTKLTWRCWIVNFFWMDMEWQSSKTIRRVSTEKIHRLYFLDLVTGYDFTNFAHHLIHSPIPYQIPTFSKLYGILTTKNGGFPPIFLGGFRLPFSKIPTFQRCQAPSLPNGNERSQNPSTSACLDPRGAGNGGARWGHGQVEPGVPYFPVESSWLFHRDP